MSYKSIGIYNDLNLLIMYFAILAALTAVLWIVSARTGLLRNEIFSQENLCKIAIAEKIKNPRPAYSLARCQMAFWTVIICGSFIDLLIETVDWAQFKCPAIDGVNLALLGIAAGTTVVGKMIDGSQSSEQTAIIPQQDHPSSGFFLTDIIADEKGASIHRLQNVIWTVVVGGIYIAYVAKSHLLPTSQVINGELMALMGISTGAYLGLKTVENKATPATEAFKNENDAVQSGAQTSSTATAGNGTPNATTTPSNGVAADISNSEQHDY